MGAKGGEGTRIQVSTVMVTRTRPSRALQRALAEPDEGPDRYLDHAASRLTPTGKLLACCGLCGVSQQPYHTPCCGEIPLLLLPGAGTLPCRIYGLRALLPYLPVIYRKPGVSGLDTLPYASVVGASLYLPITINWYRVKTRSCDQGVRPAVACLPAVECSRRFGAPSQDRPSQTCWREGRQEGSWG